MSCDLKLDIVNMNLFPQMDLNLYSKRKHLQSKHSLQTVFIITEGCVVYHWRWSIWKILEEVSWNTSCSSAVLTCVAEEKTWYQQTLLRSVERGTTAQRENWPHSSIEPKNWQQHSALNIFITGEWLCISVCPVVQLVLCMFVHQPW